MLSEHWRRDRSHSAGFTLVELLIVIVILGILATVTVFAVGGVSDSGEQNTEAIELKSLRTANDAYYIEFGENASEQDLVDNGYLASESTLFDLTVDGDGALTITNVRTGDVAHSEAAERGWGDGADDGAATLGALEGVLTNAATGSPISGAEVCVQSTGDCVTTDGSGTYAIADVPTGDQTITFSRAGFAPFDETATVTEGAATTQNTAMSPQLAAGDVRIVLTWGERPDDLDSYLDTPDGQVWYSDEGSLTSSPFAQLDVDDTDGFGPETITISQLDSGDYTFAVNSLDGPFVPEETTVRVYDSSGLINEFSPPAGTGLWWQVFTLDGSTGAVTSVNTVGSDSGPFADDPF